MFGRTIQFPVNGTIAPHRLETAQESFERECASRRAALDESPEKANCLVLVAGTFPQQRRCRLFPEELVDVSKGFALGLGGELALLSAKAIETYATDDMKRLLSLAREKFEVPKGHASPFCIRTNSRTEAYNAEAGRAEPLRVPLELSSAANPTSVYHKRRAEQFDPLLGDILNAWYGETRCDPIPPPPPPPAPDPIDVELRAVDVWLAETRKGFLAKLDPNQQALALALAIASFPPLSAEANMRLTNRVGKSLADTIEFYTRGTGN